MNPTMNNQVIPNFPIDQLTRRCCSRLWLILALGAFYCAHTVDAETRRLTRDQLLDKIKGGWAGQMIGVSFGAPTEFKAQGKTYDEELKWSPDRVSNAIEQDDLYVEMTFAKVMDVSGLEATCE